jgi:hypothetical protein
MRRSSKPLPKDPNKLSFEIVRLSTEEPEERLIEPERSNERSPISEYLSKIGKKGGLKGGPARAKKLSAKRRKKIAQQAARARWDKKV